MNYQSTLLVVSDMKKARHFYEELLGQKVLMDLNANVSYTSGIALQTKSSWVDFIGKPASEIQTMHNSAELYFEETDLDGFKKKLEAFGSVRLVHPLKEQSWGQRVLRFYDPDGHMIEVGEDMTFVINRFLAQGLTVEQTAARTLYPLGVVQEIANNAQNAGDSL